MARLFAAGGLFDQFAEQQLAPFVDMAKRPWQWLQPIGSSNGALAPFELARRLRDGLFAGGAVARAGFTLKPAGLDAGSGEVVLDLDGQTGELRPRPDAADALRLARPRRQPPGPAHLRPGRRRHAGDRDQGRALGLVPPAARGAAPDPRVSPICSA